MLKFKERKLNLPLGIMKYMMFSMIAITSEVIRELGSTPSHFVFISNFDQTFHFVLITMMIIVSETEKYSVLNGWYFLLSMWN